MRRTTNQAGARRMKRTFIIILAVTFVLTLLQGHIPVEEAMRGLIARLLGHSNEWNVILDERLPRLIVLIGTGAALSVAGAIMQSLFQNELASPSVLGIASGGSLFVVLLLATGLHVVVPALWPLAAASGCLVTLLLVYNMSKRRGEVQMHSLILTGIALSTLIITFQSVFIYLLRDHWQLRQTIYEWEAGSTINRSWQHVNMQLPLIVIGLGIANAYKSELDLLSLGEEEALNLGVDVKRVRWRLFLASSLLTGAAIAGIGQLAFFGLMAPHLLRHFAGPRNEKLIPLCLFGGGALLASMDLFLRVFQIRVVTIGNVTAILGGLFFLFLLLDSRLRTESA